MHISAAGRRDRNVLAAWAVAVADTVRSATETSTGLAGGAPAALVAIVADPGLSVDQLRLVLTLTHPGTVRLVDRLVEQGWVRREHGTGRTLRLEPTPAGRDAERRLATARENAIAQVLASLADGDVHALVAIIDPLLHRTTDTVADMRTLCRLCDRAVCRPCPVQDARDGPTGTARHANG